MIRRHCLMVEDLGGTMDSEVIAIIRVVYPNLLH